MADPSRAKDKTEATRGRKHETGERDLAAGALEEGASFSSSVDLEDPDEPAAGAMQGGNHTQRDDKDRIMGQGKKTLAAHRDQWNRGGT